MDLQLEGRRALVNGGTRGISRAIVETLAAQGASVAFCARNPDEVAATVAALSAESWSVFGAEIDVSDGAALTTWVAASAELLGGIDIVVSNVSALAIGDGADNWNSSFQVDLMGAVRMVDAAMDHLLASECASTIAISSVSGREVDFAGGPYGTMKAALVHYISGLAFQLAGQGIRANVVSPGSTYFEGGVWHQMQAGNPEFFASALELNPTGRMGTPIEMARAATFLASPVSSFTSGTNLVVDGALTRGVQL